MGVVLHLHTPWRVSWMGFLKRLFGQEDDTYPYDSVQKPKVQRHYRRIHRWIESRVGTLDAYDCNHPAKLEQLLQEETKKYPSLKGKVSITYSGNDTIITGNTLPFKNRLKCKGCYWDASKQAWVAKNKKLTEEDIDKPSELAGLEAYIKSAPYRQNF